MKKLSENNDNIKKSNKLFIPIILVIIIIAIISIVIYINIVSNPSTKLKKYLKDNDYVCNNETCSKIISEENHIVNYKNGDINISNSEYSVTINNNVTLQINKLELICTYKYNKDLKPVTEALTNQSICNTYTVTVNHYLNNYNEIITKENIDYSKIVK